MPVTRIMGNLRAQVMERSKRRKKNTIVNCSYFVVQSLLIKQFAIFTFHTELLCFALMVVFQSTFHTPDNIAVILEDSNFPPSESKQHVERELHSGNRVQSPQLSVTDQGTSTVTYLTSLDRIQAGTFSCFALPIHLIPIGIAPLSYIPEVFGQTLRRVTTYPENLRSISQSRQENNMLKNTEAETLLQLCLSLF